MPRRHAGRPDAAGARPGRTSTGRWSTSSWKQRGISRRVDGDEKGGINTVARNAPPRRRGLSGGASGAACPFFLRLLQQPPRERRERRALGDRLGTDEVIRRLRLELDVEGGAKAPGSEIGIDHRPQRERDAEFLRCRLQRKDVG